MGKLIDGGDASEGRTDGNKHPVCRLTCMLSCGQAKSLIAIDTKCQDGQVGSSCEDESIKGLHVFLCQWIQITEGSLRHGITDILLLKDIK